MTASNRFEDRLLTQLQDVVAARPATGAVARRPPRRARLALAGVGVATATAVVALVATSSDVTPSAYAVDSRPDGSVSVEIHSLRDAAGLQRSLRDAGVPAVVDYAAAGKAGCVGGPGPDAAGGAPSAPSTRTDGEGGTDTGPSLSGPAPAGATTSSVAVGSDGVTFTIDPGDLKPGERVYITTSTGAVSSIGMAITSDGPPCATR